ncbi:electron transfer flavoprotein subunit alpha/FixB family protein [Arcanobacterium hippocoleae]
MTTWIITASTAEIGNIITAAGEGAKLLVCGSPEFAAKFSQAPVTNIFHLDPENSPIEAYAPEVARFLADNAADTILAPNFAAERALATTAAAKIGATWVSGAVSWDCTKREAVRNVAAMSLQTIAVSGAAAFTLPAAAELTENSELSGSKPEFTKLELTPVQHAEIVSEQPAAANSSDLSKAQRVIGVGRGIAAENDLLMIRNLAAAIDAQIGGTRPLAEGYGWFDSYIGLTGQPVAADLYLAIGTSGQIHHAGGVRESNIIAAICDDPQAPIFHEADYGIVGDLYEIVPQIQAAL